MKHVLICALSLTFAISTFAAESVSLQTEVCGQVTGIEHWTFERSGNVVDGVPDYQGYVRVVFLPTTIAGHTVKTTKVLEVKNLVWDKNLKAVVFQGQDGVTICGKNTFLGTRLNKACGMEFKVLGTAQNQHCQNVDATIMEGVFTVK